MIKLKLTRRAIKKYHKSFTIFLYCLAIYSLDKSPIMARFTRGYTLYFFALFATAIYINAIQFTPFKTIDNSLLNIEKLLGINVLEIVRLMNKYPKIKQILEILYDTITVELFIIPFVLSALKAQKRLNEFLLGILISVLVGGLFYYFFPTTAPYSMFQTNDFLAEQKDTFLKFVQIHNHIKPTTSQGGMIAMPSFHVIYALIIIYATRKNKSLYYIAMPINIVAIFSTILLGWHYILDVIGGIILFALTIWTIKIIYKRMTQKISLEQTMALKK